MQQDMSYQLKQKGYYNFSLLIFGFIFFFVINCLYIILDIQQVFIIFDDFIEIMKVFDYIYEIKVFFSF